MGTVNEGTQAPPAAPSMSSSISDWVENYPRLIEAQEKYGARDLESQRSAQAQAYPEYESLRGDLMTQISQGIGEKAPEWYMGQYGDYAKSILGDQITGGLGVDYYSTGMLEQQKSWNDYYRNMAASFSGQQPIFNASSPTQNFNPGQAMSFNQGNYGTQMAGFNSQQNRALQAGQYNAEAPWRATEGVGNLIGGFAGQGGGFMGWGGR